MRKAGKRRGIPWEIRRLGSVESTNTYLLAEAALGAPEGLVVAADHQTAGRGRQGRVWDDRPGSSLLFSALFRPVGEPVEHLYGQAMALAVSDACFSLYEVRAGLKWPNDVLIEDRKLAGILSEAVSSGGRVSAIVVGCGVNLNWGDSPPSGFGRSAVSLDEPAGRVVDQDAFLDSLLDALEQRLENPRLIVAQYRKACVTLGREVRVEQAGTTLKGIAVDISDDGSLVLRTAAGDQIVSIGDVIHLR